MFLQIRTFRAIMTTLYGAIPWLFLGEVYYVKSVITDEKCMFSPEALKVWGLF